MKIMKVTAKANNLVSNFKLYWKEPPQGNYMNYKEIVSLAFGGMGAKFIISCVSAMILSTGNFLIGNVIGLDQDTIYVLYVISVLAGFPLTGLRAHMIDNTRSKKGKYRPYLVYMGLPTSVLAIIFLWAPYELMNDFGKSTVILLCNIGFQFFYKFYNDDVYTNYIVVLSPNTQERANVSAVKALTDSFAPSFINIVIPLGAKMITGQNTLDKLIVYRYLYTPLIVLGFILSMLIYVNTTERIVQARTHIVKVKFMDALREVAKNRYFWVISFAGWLGFLETSYACILQWLYNYQNVCSAGVYSFITAVYGNASFWGMLFAPALIKRFGKKKLLVSTNLMNIIFIGAMYPVIKYIDPQFMVWFLLICLFMNGAVCAVAHIVSPCINGDVRDYQQYVSGERIDGMFSTVGLIGTVIMLLTSSVQPYLYKLGGISEAKALELGVDLSAEGVNIYHVLYNESVFYNVIAILIGASVVGAIMNVIPFFFYDMTESKQKGLVNILKIRAVLEDYNNGVISKDSLAEVAEIIDDARNSAERMPTAVDRSADRIVKREIREENENIEIAKIVMHEIGKFDTPAGKQQLKYAGDVYANGFDGIANADASVLKAAKSMPRNTEAEKEIRKFRISYARMILSAREAMEKYFPNGVREQTDDAFAPLYEEENRIIAELENAYKNLKEANDSNNRNAAEKYKTQIRSINLRRKTLDRKIKEAIDENSHYMQATKPYFKAKQLLQQADNYSKLDEIIKENL